MAALSVHHVSLHGIRDHPAPPLKNTRTKTQSTMAQDPQVLEIQNSDTCMSLVSVPLDGSNYFTWSRLVKISLAAMMKLPFIDGKVERPKEGDDAYQEWVRADCMVTCWILNSISKEIVESFLYATTARELWVELETRFGQRNGPMIYRLNREIYSTIQGTMTVSAYFSRLKRLWDELSCLNPLPQCSCGASKAIDGEDHLMQFLMGLSDDFDSVRSQILMLEPLPSVSKAYGMVLRMEKQREVHLGSAHNMAMQVKGGNFRRFGNSSTFQRRKTAAEKRAQTCDHCGKNGHTKEMCFEIHGYPEWYKI
ncbi:UNVERIFIED_CONTAM: hypothetical protein Sindi_2835600 [Sesamum indicum]